MEQFLVFVLVVGGLIFWFVSSSNANAEKKRKSEAFHSTMAEFRRAVAAGENPRRETRHLVEEVEVTDPSGLQSAIQQKIDETTRSTYYDEGAAVNIVSTTKAIIHFHGDFPPGV